jgi:hypothetical protein
VLIDGMNNPTAVINGIYIFENVTTNHTIHLTFKKEVAIDENMNQKIQIFPNPTCNEIFIKSELSIKKVEIYSITGELLFAENNFKEKISVPNLLKGVYFLKIDTGNVTSIQKIVKK